MASNIDTLRQAHANNFNFYYIDDSIKRDIRQPPSPTSKPIKRRGKKRPRTDESDPPLAKRPKMNSSDEYSPFRRSSRNKKRSLDQSDDQVSPHTKKTTSAKSPTSTFTDIVEIKEEPSSDANSDPFAAREPRKEAKGKGKVKASPRLTPKANPGFTPHVKKVNPPPIVPDDFAGTATGNGTSNDAPPNADLDEPWGCANRTCNSGMTWFTRDAAHNKGVGRKAISNFFGRNKSNTKSIPQDVWHTYCRKCYQRLYYAAVRTPAGAFEWHLKNLRMQFLRLKLWRPEAKFRVTLSNQQYKRNDVWHRILRKHGGDEGAAQAEYAAHAEFGEKERPAKKGKKEREMREEEAFPVQLTDEFESDVCGDDADYDRLDEILEHLVALREDGTLARMPPIEFLIREEVEGEKIVDPESNYERWIAATDGMDFDGPEASDQEGNPRTKLHREMNDLHTFATDDPATVAAGIEEVQGSREDDETITVGGGAERGGEEEKAQQAAADDDEEEGEAVASIEPPPAFTPISLPPRRRFKLTPGEGMVGGSAKKSGRRGYRIED